MSLWDWIFIFYCAAAGAVATLVWYRCSREIPKEKICDGCGQVCTVLRDGLCVYCDNHFRPSSKPLP